MVIIIPALSRFSLWRCPAKSFAAAVTAFLAILVSISDVEANPFQTTATYTVTSAGGSVSENGTLPWAVFQANYYGADTNYINFNIPAGPNEIVIVLTDTLYIARPMIIDATSQPGYVGQPRIHIDGNGFPSSFHVVTVTDGSIPPFSDGSPATGGGSTIQGFRITDYSSNGITLASQSDGNTIAHNQIGFAPLSAPGTFSKNITLYPGCRGIGIASNSNIIQDNTISGVDNAITLGPDGSPVGFTCRNNTFQDNFIGTDATGMIKIGNTSDGIFLGLGAQQNVIGPGNVLSGMASSGVELLDPTVTGNIIYGNLIGLNASGTAVIGNGELGVLIANGASNNIVGGSYGGVYPGNVISGNTLGGVSIGTDAYPVPANNNRVEGNFIGTDPTQSESIGAQEIGINLQNQAQGNVIRRNVIVGQTIHGIAFIDANDNDIYGNWIGATSTGKIIANLGYGVYLGDSTNNIVQPPLAEVALGKERNIFGANAQAPVLESGSSSNNIIDLSTSSSHLQNISTRATASTGGRVLIAGFIVTGTEPKKVIVRAIGTSLNVNGVPVPGRLEDPVLELHGPGGGIIASNDNWMDAPNVQEIIDSTIPPSDPAESAVLTTLPANDSAYTAIVKGQNDTSGVALVEVYDLDNGSTDSKLANISTRGFLETSTDAMIGGFILGSGDGIASEVILRALGPSLANTISGALMDPSLELYDANGAIVAANDNWADDPNKQAVIDHGLAPTDSRESAIDKVLQIGAYTTILRGVNGAIGVGLVESYDVSSGDLSP